METTLEVKHVFPLITVSFASPAILHCRHWHYIWQSGNKEFPLATENLRWLAWFVHVCFSLGKKSDRYMKLRGGPDRRVEIFQYSVRILTLFVNILHFRNLSAIQDREICCYSISCKEKENIGKFEDGLMPVCSDCHSTSISTFY